MIGGSEMESFMLQMLPTVVSSEEKVKLASEMSTMLFTYAKHTCKSFKYRRAGIKDCKTVCTIGFGYVRGQIS